MDRIESLKLFASIAELESFKQAADRMGITSGAASKQVSSLEHRLQARLLERSTRKVRLTDAGRVLLDRIRPWLDEYDSIEEGLITDNAAATGVLRVTAPVDFGALRLVEPIADFMENWPNVEVRLELNDRMVDLIDEGFDLAIRIGKLQDSSLISRRLADAPLGLFASPDFVKANGEPDHPSDLTRFACLIDRNAHTPNVWKFTNSNQTTEVKVKGRLSLNGARANLSAACSSIGIAHSPIWAANEWVESGRLVPLLSHWTSSQRDLWAVFPSNRFMTHRVRLLVDHLARHFKSGL